jgi:CheY-like chemotaxis protein
MAVADRLKENVGTLSGKTILVAEDDQIFCEGLRSVLEREGCVVVFAANGREALSRLQCQPFPHLFSTW